MFPPHRPALRPGLASTTKTLRASDFIAAHDDEKDMGILAKTARKMSPDGLAAAQKLTLDERLGSLLVKALG